MIRIKTILSYFLLLICVHSYAQTRKVLLEYYTGVDCNLCGLGADRIYFIEKQNVGTILPVAIHIRDFSPDDSPLATPEGDAIYNGIPTLYFPHGMVDRKLYTGPTIPMQMEAWVYSMLGRLDIPPIASVNFSNAVHTGGNNYEADVEVEFTAPPIPNLPINLQVYIIENRIPATGALRQLNHSSSYLQGGRSPLTNWYHDGVLRKALGGAWGYEDVIPQPPVAGTKYTKHINFSVKQGASPEGWVKENIVLYAFVSYNGLAENDQKEVLNAEEIKLSSFYPTSVATQQQSLTKLDVYPNPSGINNPIQIEYNLKRNTQINIQFFNTMGQIVASINRGMEIPGMHIFKWHASDYGLNSGIYFIQLKTSDNMITRRINIL